MIALDRFAYLEEVLLAAAVVVIDKETAGVPLILSVVEDLVLDVGGLASLHRRRVDLLGAVRLLRHVLHLGQVL